MSVNVFFSLSSGLSGPLSVPTGTLAAIQQHVREIENTLGLKTTKYKDSPAHWIDTRPTKKLDDEAFCLTASRHNDWVRDLFKKFGLWSTAPVKDGEQLTPADAQTFWHGLEMIDVPAERWSEDYYRERMEHVYEVLRGRNSQGVFFDGEKPLTPKQAASVICLFSEYLDVGDQRLDVPLGHDYLASSADGGYDWCEKCGAITWDDVGDCRKRGCPLRKEWCEENRR